MELRWLKKPDLLGKKSIKIPGLFWDTEELVNCVTVYKPILQYRENESDDWKPVPIVLED
jgi:hypothetical protein